MQFYRNQGTDWHVTKVSRNRFLYFLENNSGACNFKGRISKNLFRWLHCLGSALITEHSTGFSQWNTMKLDFYTVGVLPKTLMPRRRFCNKYRKHWKSYVGFQLSGQAGLFLAARTENFCNFAKESYCLGFFFIFLFQNSTKLEFLHIVASAVKSWLAQKIIKSQFWL